jgi:uncharacterized membrane protein (DUF2068 family)
LLAVAIMVGITVHFAVQALGTLTRLRGGDAETQRALIELGVPLEGAPTALVTVAAVVLATCVLYLLAAAGIWFRRPWGREAGGLLAGVLALIAIPLSIGGLTASAAGTRPVEGLVVGAINVAVVVLLVHRATTRDFAAHEHWRSRRTDRAR